MKLPLSTVSLLILVSSVLFNTNASAKVSADDSWEQALNGPQRTPAYSNRDVYRHPQQTLQFFEVTPASTVVEIWPGGGWYTEILAPLLRDEGRLYAAHFPSESGVAYYDKSRAAFVAKLAADSASYSQVEIRELSPPGKTAISPLASADTVLTFRNVHNWLKAGNAEGVFAAMYASLKPGGVLGVVEHRAKPGTSLEDMIQSGYVTEQQVKDLALGAGFEFVAASEVNANPKDTARHPKGVWTLPPSLRLADQDPAKYLAIGESDRMTLKFLKPVEVGSND